MYSPYIGVTFSICSFGNCYCDWPNRWHLSLCDGFLRLHRLFWRCADRMSIKDSQWTSLSLQGLSSQTSLLYLLFNSVLSDFCSAGAITVCGRLHAAKTFVCDHLASKGRSQARTQSSKSQYPLDWSFPLLRPSFPCLSNREWLNNPEVLPTFETWDLCYLKWCHKPQMPAEHVKCGQWPRNEAYIFMLKS